MLGACVAYVAVALPYPRETKRTRLSSSTARWWAMLLAVSQLMALSSKAEAAGWSWTGGKAGQRGAPTSGGADEDMSEALSMLERKQFWGGVEHVGLEALENEVAEKKRRQISRSVAEACSIGAQMTLIMGGGALLFRLLPVILGHDQEDEEEAELNSPYLLRSGVDSINPQALPSTGRRRLLTDGSEAETEATEATAKSEASEAVAAAAAAGLTGEEGDGGVSVKAGASRAVVSLTSDGEEDVGDGEVVAFTRRGAVLKRVRRLSRPLLTAMAVPLTLLLTARVVLGGQLAKRVDPTIELLFGDDIVDLYAEKVDMPSADEVMPFAMDSDFVPGRTKMRGRSVQRPPRPDGEENTEWMDEEEALP
ncbi:unnamed protein product [Laminaria digitata]